MSEAKQRIQFIDLAKGICITLVVLHHCHIETPYLVYIRMPLYFILSGLFFKTYDGLADFTKRKINKILIPFLFFYSISFILYDNEGKSFISKYRDLLLGCLFAVIFLVLANISCTISPIGVSLRYIYSISGVLALLLILKKIKNLPVISYYGRYSIVILCTSYLVYSPLRVIIPRLIPELGGVNDYIAFIITMLFEYFKIWFCIRCLPYFTAQKDLIPVGKGSI